MHIKRQLQIDTFANDSKNWELFVKHWASSEFDSGESWPSCVDEAIQYILLQSKRKLILLHISETLNELAQKSRIRPGKD